MSVKLSRIITDKNVIWNTQKNEKVTTKDFPLQTSKLFECAYMTGNVTASMINVQKLVSVSNMCESTSTCIVGC